MAQNMEDRAFEMLEEMNRRGVYPRADTFNSILTGLSKVSVSRDCFLKPRIGLFEHLRVLSSPALHLSFATLS